MAKENPKVLVAEDDLFISEVYSAKLSSEGFDVVLAENGEAAWEKYKEENPKIILLDILMPKIDGWEVLQKIREADKKNEKIIIMLTNVGDKEAISKAIKAGADDYFIKSFFTPEEIVIKIKKIMDSRG